MSLLSVEEALARVLDLAPRMAAETVPLAEAWGRVLAEDAVAARDQPPFPASAMDGYAVRAAEAGAGATLPLAGEAAAGRGYPGPLPLGEAVRIFTGAPVPEGADTILIQENAEARDGAVQVLEAPAPGAHIRAAGADFASGARLAAPRRLSSRDIALLAAMNAAEVAVARRPVVALVPTGDELVLPGAEPAPDQIVTSNNFGLAARLQAEGAVPRLCPIARDTPESLAAALAVAEGADIVVTLGGASVGAHDLVAQLGLEAGFDRALYKIAMRPGKPLIAGRLRGTPLLGLPGNPVSAMICGEVFLVPAIRAALGLPAGPRSRRPARLAHALGPNGPREHYARAVVTERDGTASARLFGNQDSALLFTLAEANAVAIRPPGAPPAAEGDWIDTIPLDAVD